MKRLIDGYICYEDGQRVVMYKCDPNKNTMCTKTTCAFRRISHEGCDVTKNRAARLDGTKPFYLKVERGMGNRFVYEYIEEPASGTEGHAPGNAHERLAETRTAGKEGKVNHDQLNGED